MGKDDTKLVEDKKENDLSMNKRTLQTKRKTNK